MRTINDRCDHCGKFASRKHPELYTLYGHVEHDMAESVAVCEPCCDKYSDAYWQQWIDARFAGVSNDSSAAH